jgi:hypothetical protein
MSRQKKQTLAKTLLTKQTNSKLATQDRNPPQKEK